MTPVAKEQLAFSIRPATKDDEPFIYATWLRSYRHDSHFARRIRDAVFYEYHHSIVERALARASTLLAVDPDDASVIYGYLVAETYNGRPVVQFAYVKSPFRELGVARALFAAARVETDRPCFFTHWTRACDALTKRFPELIYNPYLL